MRICRLILAVGVVTTLLYAGSAVSKQSASGATQSNPACDALTPGELYQHLFGESVADARRLLATIETVSALRLPHGMKTDPFGPMSSARQATNPPVAQRALASSGSSRSKPRRTRPAPSRGSRPKSISQRTRQVGKEARARSTSRLKNNRARVKQRTKGTPVTARRKGYIARKPSTKRSPATSKRNQPKATNK